MFLPNLKRGLLFLQRESASPTFSILQEPQSRATLNAFLLFLNPLLATMINPAAMDRLARRVSARPPDYLLISGDEKIMREPWLKELLQLGGMRTWEKQLTIHKQGTPQILVFPRQAD